MKKQKKNTQNGITLIALVITIIVLLILAGVSINAIVGQNGILNKTQEAVVETKKASVLEEAQMVLVEWQSDHLISNTPYEGRTAQTTSGADVLCTAGKIIVVDNENGNVYAADFPNGEKLGDWNKVDINADDPATKQIYRAMNPVIPTGFTHTEGEWNTGYVIKDGKGDEFVWVPVVSEASYARKSGSRNWHMSAQNVNDCGKDVTQYILGDKLGLTSILGTAITETERSGETPANIPEAAVVNAAGGFYVSRYEIGIENATRTTGTQADSRTASTQYFSQAGKEPARRISQVDSLAIANGWKTGANYQSGLITGTQWDVMCNFIGWSKCDSDCTNWGNYININSKDYAANEVWHAKFQKDSGLDLWTNEAVKKGNRNVAADVDKTDRMVFATGKFVNADGGTTEAKHIFDVAGNVWEWTTEVPTQDATHRVLRGGSTNYYGYDNLATNRHGYNSASHSNWPVGFRAVLYVKPQ